MMCSCVLSRAQLFVTLCARCDTAEEVVSASQDPGGLSPGCTKGHQPEAPSLSKGGATDEGHSSLLGPRSAVNAKFSLKKLNHRDKGVVNRSQVYSLNNRTSISPNPDNPNPGSTSEAADWGVSSPQTLVLKKREGADRRLPVKSPLAPPMRGQETSHIHTHKLALP